VSPFLHTAVASFRDEELLLIPQKRVIGGIGRGPVDFAIEYKDTLICVTECKATDVKAGVSQNLAQLNSAAEVKNCEFSNVLKTSRQTFENGRVEGKSTQLIYYTVLSRLEMIGFLSNSVLQTTRFKLLY
jgi:hypothetical protein